MTMERYSVRYYTATEQRGEYVQVVHIAWWLYDWGKRETVQMFKVSEEEQAHGLCKLLNSIEKEKE